MHIFSSLLCTTFLHLIPAAHGSPDADEAVAVHECDLWQRQNNLAEARRCYVTLAPHLSDAEHRAAALYRAAALASHVENDHIARDELARLVDALPYTEGARRAFVMARAMYRESEGAAGEADFLMRVASRLAWVSEPGATHGAEPPAHDLLAEALVEVGRIRLADVNDVPGAHRILERAETVARGTVWEDDAQIWLARSLRQMERRDEALKLYHALVDAQKTSWFVGDYASEFYDDALYEIGETLEELMRYDEAQQAYAELFKRAPTSRLLDDAAYRLAALNARRTGTAAPFTAFVRDYPDSRYARGVRNAVHLK